MFNDRIDKVLRHLLLDHILAPPTFTAGTPRVLTSTGTVDHDVYNAHNAGDWTKKTKPKRNLYPSDHRPASVMVRV